MIEYTAKLLSPKREMNPLIFSNPNMASSLGPLPKGVDTLATPDAAGSGKRPDFRKKISDISPKHDPFQNRVVK